LKLSLQYHPDKNPPDQAKEVQAKFVEIGRAYEILKDESFRAAYDRELRSGRGGGSRYRTSAGPTPSDDFAHDDVPSSEAYESYRDFFDETVAGMSEADLAAAVGAAALIGSLVGSLLGHRLVSNSTAGRVTSRSSAGSGILTTAGSLVGSAVASEMAASSVRQLHQSSIQRIEYKRACRIARERGEPLPAPPAPTAVDQFLGKTMLAVKNATQHPEQTVQSIGNLWNKARASMDAAAKFSAAASAAAAAASSHPQGHSSNGAAGGTDPYRASYSR